MKVFASSKVLCALLAAVAAGQGAQAWMTFQVQREVTALRAAQRASADEAEEGPAAVHPPVTLTRRGGSPSRVFELFDTIQQQLGDELGPLFAQGPHLWSDAHGFPLEAELGAQLRDQGDHYEWTFDLPPDTAEEVDTRILGRSLVVRAEAQEAGRASRFERRTSLPGDADPSTLDARLEGRQLRVRLSKRETPRVGA